MFVSPPAFLNKTANLELKGIFLLDLGKVLLHSDLTRNKDLFEKFTSFERYPSVSAALEHTLGSFFARVALTEFYEAGSWNLPKTRESYEIMLGSLLDPEWRDYLAGKYETFKLAPEIINHFYENFVLLLQRLEADWRQLVDAGLLDSEDELSDIVPAGDYHHNGKVSLLYFKSGKKLLYKPHAVGNTKFVSAIFEHVNEVIGLELRTPKSVGDVNYHWQEFVQSDRTEQETLKIETVDLHSLGAILAIGVYLGIRDLHAENIIFADSAPIVIDYECVAMPYLNKDVTGYSITPADIGILPQSIGFKGFNNKFDWSLFGAVPDDFYPAWGQHNFSDEGLPTVRMVEPADDLLDQRTIEIGISDVEAICCGYEAAFTAIRGLSFEQIECLLLKFEVTSRVIFRATQLYANCMRRATYPQYMHTIAAHKQKYRELLGDLGVNAETVDFEVNELVYRRVPLLEARAAQEIICGTEIISPLTVVSRQLLKHNLPNQLSIDIRHIKQIFESTKENPVDLPKVGDLTLTNNNSLTTEIITRLVDEICKNATLLDGLPIWNNLIKTNSGDWVVSQERYSLYHGGAGIFLSLAAAKSAGIIFSDESQRVYDNLRHALTNYVRDADNETLLGFFDGIAGVVYALAQDSSGDVVKELFAKLCKLIILRDVFPGSDVISGAAGVLGFISEGRLKGYGGEEAELAEEKLVDYLKTAKKIDSAGNAIWEESEDWIGGFAHGPLGVAWAISRSSQKDKQQKLITEAWESQRFLYDDAQQKWRRSAKGNLLNMSAWCHGSEGVSQSLKSIAELIGGAAHHFYLRETESVLADGLPEDLTVCHGLSGRLLALFNTDSPAFIEGKEVLKNCLSALVDSDLCLSDGFMVGRAGVLFAASKILLGADVGNPLFCELKGYCNE
ncbi:DUF4135 domain-containing protein [Leucobacter sp. OH2974_COT-288]|nr:DUF4135 domain-containing protein [Leucobacter sp. OH2974_COT-288]